MMLQDEFDKMRFKYMKKKGEVKANDRFTFPYEMSKDDFVVKENDGLSKEIIELAKEEIVNSM